MKKPCSMALRSYPDHASIVAAWQEEAARWIGTPYRHQAAKRGVGADCIGLIAGVWAGVYGAAPFYARTYSRDWAETGVEERILRACQDYCAPVLRDAFAEGDLLVFRIRHHALAKHIGICTAADRMIHAVERHAVQDVKLTDWWTRRLVGAFRPPRAYVQKD